jgi:ATP:corrinoid adenosyltransferase
MDVYWTGFYMTELRRILLFTGDGKGKTTAALGMALRALGHGQHAAVFQFAKANPSRAILPALLFFVPIKIIHMAESKRELFEKVLLREIWI